MNNDFESDNDFFSSPSFNKAYELDNPPYLNAPFTNAFAFTDNNLRNNNIAIHDFLVQFREMLILHEFTSAKQALDSVIPEFSVIYPSFHFFLFLLELIFIFQQKGKEAGLAFYHTNFCSFSSFLKAKPKKSAYLEILLENTRLVNNPAFKERIDSQFEKFLAKLANTLYSCKFTDVGEENDCNSEDSLSTVNFSEIDEVDCTKISKSTWEIVNEEHEFVKNRQEAEVISENWISVREYRKVNFSKIKKENVDKIVIRKFKTYLKNEFKHNKQLFTGCDQQFWLNFISFNRLPPFSTTELKGDLQIFRSFNYRFLNWLFCRQGAIELWTNFCEKRGDLEIRNIVGKYRIDEKEEVMIKKYVFELAMVINRAKGDSCEIDPRRNNHDDSYSSSEES